MDLCRHLSDYPPPMRVPLVTAPLLAAALLGTAGCGSDVRRFPLRDPLWVDADRRPFMAPCKPDKEDPKHKICMPESYESAFLWDGADNMVFRPVARFWAVDPAGESANVNSMDEVADSSWFTNRLGRKPMSASELVRGPCGDKVLDPTTAADGSWLVDQGKPNGANPGFRIKVEGIGKFMLKADPPDQPERATGATSIAARLYHAAGWFAPCDSVVYVKRSLLKLKPGLEFADNTGVKRKFDEAALDGVLAKASKRGDLVRMVASRWLPGRTLGPFRYEGTRDDDPNDVVDHQDRRDLRGARVIAAWLNHFDSREQNSMDTWMADGDDPDSSPGHIQHWYIDLGDCFGSEWEEDGISRRLGHANYFDFQYVPQDFVTLGLIPRPWDRAQRSKDGAIFGYFHSRDFDPDDWKGGYPNPAFGRMSARDAAWAARTIARFTPELIEAAVRAGDFTDPQHTAFLVKHLRIRQHRILRTYFAELSPIADVTAAGAELCGHDLARWSAAWPASAFRYSAKMYAGARLDPRRPLTPRPAADGGVCVTLPHVADDGGLPDDAPARYAVVDISNGQASGPLRAHLYDLGPSRGFKLVGIERPDDAGAPD
jgi:hypothetical protein